MRDGAWVFGGDGTPGFEPPLAPLPVEESPPKFWSKGDKVEVGPTDEGYVGSWFAGVIVDTSPEKVAARSHLEIASRRDLGGVG